MSEELKHGPINNDRHRFMRSAANLMRRIAFLLVAAVMAAVVVAFTAHASGHADETATPIFGIKRFPGYRDWRLISVAHEEGNLSDIRAILGNYVAIKAYRENQRPFPDGTVTARIARNYVSSKESNKVFGRSQSFVAGAAPSWYLQFMVKDSQSILQQAAGVLPNLIKMAILPTRQNTKPATPAMSLAKLTTMSSPITRLKEAAIEAY